MQPIQRIEAKKSYEADIVVYDPDGSRIELIAEVMHRLVGDPRAISEELRKVMLWVNCHNGLLITPENVYVYRDTFEGSAPDAIEIVGRPLATATVLGQFAANRDLDDLTNLKFAVVSWLEALSTNWFGALSADGDVAYAFLPEIVADVAHGHVRLGEAIYYG